MQFKILVTDDGTHPPHKWADLAVDDIMEISSSAKAGLIAEAKMLRAKFFDLLTQHHHRAITDEQKQIAAGRHTHDHPFETEDHAKEAADELVAATHGTSFQSHFAQAHVQEHLANVCNHYFKSAKHVEREHFHAKQARVAKKSK